MKKKSEYTASVKNRSRLRALNGLKTAFQAIVGRRSMTGFKTQGIRQETVELKRICAWGRPEEILADHVWVKLDDISNREIIDDMPAEGGQMISFTGVVYPYGEPFQGKSFWGFADRRYSIGNIDIMNAAELPAS